MKIDIILYKISLEDEDKLRKFYRITQLEEVIFDRTSRKPVIHHNIKNLKEDHYYFLFCPGIENFKNEFEPISDQMVLFSSHWSDIEMLEENFQFLGIVIFVHYLQNHDTLFGQKKAIEKMDVTDVWSHVEKVNQKRTWEDMKYRYINGKKDQGTVNLVIDYLEIFEQCKAK